MLIIVDFTALDPNIHNKNDKNSVNDPDAKRAMLKKLVSCYVTYCMSSLCTCNQSPQTSLSPADNDHGSRRQVRASAQAAVKTLEQRKRLLMAPKRPRPLLHQLSGSQSARLSG